MITLKGEWPISRYNASPKMVDVYAKRLEESLQTKSTRKIWEEHFIPEIKNFRGKHSIRKYFMTAVEEAKLVIEDNELDEVDYAILIEMTKKGKSLDDVAKELAARMFRPVVCGSYFSSKEMENTWRKACPEIYYDYGLEMKIQQRGLFE